MITLKRPMREYFKRYVDTVSEADIGGNPGGGLK